MTRRGDIRIGISGWRYKGWRGSFYPHKLPQKAELGFAATRFNSIELNGTFYALQRPESFTMWYEETPPDFVFSVKGSRYLTHMLRVTRFELPLANFFAQGILRFREKLGPILWQFPPQFRFNASRLDTFFKMLPRTHKAAAELGRLRDERLNERSYLDVPTDRPLRYAIEIRNESFVSEEFIALLREHQIALVVADTVEWPLLMDLTAGFVYCRLHGSEQLYASGYDSAAITQWAQRVDRWARGKEVEDGRKASGQDAHPQNHRDVFVYFDNDAKVRAPFDAQELMKSVAQVAENAAA